MATVAGAKRCRTGTRRPGPATGCGRGPAERDSGPDMRELARRRICLVLAAAILGCGERDPGTSASSPSRPVPEGPSVLLYVVDTLRADGLPRYGNRAIETPAPITPRRASRQSHLIRFALLVRRVVAAWLESPQRVIEREGEVHHRAPEAAQRIGPVHQLLAEGRGEVRCAPDPAGEDQRVAVPAEQRQVQHRPPDEDGQRRHGGRGEREAGAASASRHSRSAPAGA